ncbi:MAG TPA: TraB/VirB10 family protein [Planctomycetota bacterium]
MKKSRLFAAAGGLAVLLVLLAFASRGPAAAQAPPDRPSFDVGLPTAQEVRNMLAVYGERVEGTEKELAALRTELAETRKRLDDDRKRDATGLEKLFQDLKSATAARPEPPPEPPAPRFRTVEFERRAGKSIHVPAGSFGEATLLTGVFAPTTGEPLPVLLKLDAALVGPRRSRVPLRDAFLVGKATGDSNSRRAVVQLQTLSTLKADGTPAEAPVNAWVTDDDGIQGLRGQYVWRADEVIALSTVGGALSGGADAMSQRETTTQVTPLGGSQGTVTGDPLKFAGYRAVASGFGRLSDMISSRAQEIVPAVYVANARRVTVAFISGATLEGLEVPAPAPPFEGLDR